MLADLIDSVEACYIDMYVDAASLPTDIPASQKQAVNEVNFLLVSMLARDDYTDITVDTKLLRAKGVLDLALSASKDGVTTSGAIQSSLVIAGMSMLGFSGTDANYPLFADCASAYSSGSIDELSGADLGAKMETLFPVTFSGTSNALTTAFTTTDFAEITDVSSIKSF